MKKDARVLLGLQALAFSMKGLNVTMAERAALREAAEAAVEHAVTDSRYALLRRAALDCADSNQQTEEGIGALRAALAAFQPVAEGKPTYDWQERRDLA